MWKWSWSSRKVKEALQYLERKLRQPWEHQAWPWNIETCATRLLQLAPVTSDEWHVQCTSNHMPRVCTCVLVMSSWVHAGARGSATEDSPIDQTTSPRLICYLHSFYWKYDQPRSDYLAVGESRTSELWYLSYRGINTLERILLCVLYSVDS